MISMSLGSELPSDGTDVLGIAANNAVAGGTIVVAAAGNAGDAPDSMASPGAASDVIAVGASSSWSAAPGAQNHSDGHLPRPVLRPRWPHVRRRSRSPTWCLPA